MKKYDAIFFDLDGTLLDTAPDLAYAMNQLLARYGRGPVLYTQFRFHVSGGTSAMLRHSFAINDNHPDFASLREQFLTIYQANLAHQTQLFFGMQQVLDDLDRNYIPWGVVTNKPEFLTEPLLEHFAISQRSCCVVSGDTLKTRKPSPEPLLYACQIAACAPSRAIYVGDTKVDIIAAKAAGMHAVGVTWGYFPMESPPSSWGADLIIRQPSELMELLGHVRNS